MALRPRLLVSLVGSALFAVAMGAAAAWASGPGSDGGDDDPFDDSILESSNSGSSGGSDDSFDDDSFADDAIDDNSGSDSGSDFSSNEDFDDNSGSDSGSSEGGSSDNFDDDGSNSGSSNESDHPDNAGDDSHSGSSSGSDHEATSDRSGSDSNSGTSGSIDSSHSGSDHGSNSGSHSGSLSDNSNSGSNSGSHSGSNSGSWSESSNTGSNSGSSHGGSGSNSNSGSSTSGGSGSNSGSGSGSGSGHNNSGDGGGDNAMHRYAYVIDHDDSGREYVHGEVLMTARPDELYAASQAGFTLISTAPLGSLGAELARIRIPDEMSIERAMAVLHGIAPHATLTSNDIYRHSQSFVASSSASNGRHSMPRLIGTLGIIDTGVDVSALPVASALLTQRAFAGPQPTPRQHGSIVASLAISHGMRVHVADVFSEAADGSIAASAESIAAALDWMIDNNIPVINVSIEGPNNAVLQQLVRTAAQRGHVIVAAAGNGGPMARPAYPAAFEGAVAVTAIDEHGNPYLRANRGAYIAFAAPGVDIDVDTGESHVQVSGTSFAAPIVAADVAEHLHSPSRTQAQRALEALRSQAVDLGAPGRDPIYGWGAVRSD